MHTPGAPATCTVFLWPLWILARSIWVYMGELRSPLEKLQFCFVSISFLHREGSHGDDAQCCREQTAISSDLLWAIHSGLELGSRQDISLRASTWLLSSWKQTDIQLVGIGGQLDLGLRGLSAGQDGPAKASSCNCESNIPEEAKN